MSAIQNMALFHKITVTEHEHGADDAWSREAGELAVKLRAWLNGSRCIIIFTIDDSFHHDLYSGKVACSFFIRGHETLVLEPEDITVELLSAAYISAEPQYYLKTDAPADAVQAILQGCVKGEGEAVLRNDDFDELAMHREFGNYIIVLDGWTEHRIVDEKNIIARNEEFSVQLDAERAASLWSKVLGRFRVAMFVLGCLTLIVPFFLLVRGLISAAMRRYKQVSKFSL